MRLAKNVFHCDKVRVVSNTTRVVFSLSLVLFTVGGCDSSSRSNNRPPGGGAMGDGGDTPDLGTTPSGGYADFPAAPVIDPAGNTPAGAPSLFGPAGSGQSAGGPCLIDPELGSLFPGNWLPLRFHFVPPTGQNLFEIRVHADQETNDLVVYTTQTTWTMSSQMWSSLAQHVIDEPITVTIRGGTYDGTKLIGGPVLGSAGTISVAPAAASGAIVYWTSSNGTALRGFTIGDTKVQDVLRPNQANTQCIGCHASTPDGDFVAFSASSDSMNGNPAEFAMRSTDGKLTTPSFISTAAATLLARSGQEEPVFSKSHWMTGDRIGLSMLYLHDTMPASQYEIVWTDLETTSSAQGTGWGILKRDGDPGDPASAAFSHDGTKVVYTSGKTTSGGVTLSDGDLRIIPYANRAGGTSTAVVGASDSAYNEFYPAFSSDDQWLAFGRLPSGMSSYNQTATEVFIVPTAGGMPTRIVANDPPACAGRPSPGITNSWPKWSPDTTVVGNRTFYWITFSSTRIADKHPQLYIAPVVIEGSTVKTYPALYLWNQPADENNHTPAWDDFQIPLQ
jgi:hypothetical protein